MQKGYKALIYATIDDYISQGYAVETLPFTPMDHVAAKILLKGLKVHHHPFCPDPYRVFTRIQTASVFFASRYHATIFGLKANVNIIPFAYAKKNEQLLNDLQIDASHFHTPDDFTNVDFTIKKIRPINYDLRQVKHLQSDANLAIQKCVDTLLNFR
jgi:polysaccharide pyruvyl transferase WcaK-like protein